MDTAKITRSETEGGFRYLYQGGAEMPPAELTGTVSGPHIWSANHTGVPPAYRGQGIALALVKALVADARRAGAKILPRCSYVAAQFVKHPEWAELLAE